MNSFRIIWGGGCGVEGGYSGYQLLGYGIVGILELSSPYLTSFNCNFATLFLTRHGQKVFTLL